MVMGQKVTDLKVFTVTEDSRFAKCNKCDINVPCRGPFTKMFTYTSLVHHLRMEPGHKEEYEKYNKLKNENDEKTESPVTISNDCMRLQQGHTQDFFSGGFHR